MQPCLEQAIEKRRSIYHIGDKPELSDQEIVEIVEQSVKYCPTAFNSQSARVAVLFGNNHHRFWEFVRETLRKVVPEDKFAPTEAKIDSFDAGHGTILFFEDETVVQKLQQDFPLYKENFPRWSEQSNGMLQYIIWTALAEHNIGASLQHYNPLINELVAKEWNIPGGWKLIAEMPFGNIEAPAGEKAMIPVAERVKIFK